MKQVSVRQWQIRGDLPQDREISLLAESLKVSDITARVLFLRGIRNVEEGKAFLDAKLADLPDPDMLPDMEIACRRLTRALQDNQKIAVHGDYDVDGITGCSLLVETLTALGGDVEYHIPLRMRDGYGLAADAVKHVAENGCRVLISVDCGVSAHEEAALARRLGLDLIITDHHQPPDPLPEHFALINPHLEHNRFPWVELSGVGVAFFLMLGLRRYLRKEGYFRDRDEPDLRYSLDLVALGTIADIVPLGGVNRILVKSGLTLLDSQHRPGICALKDVAQIKQVSSGVVGFRMAPRLNAAGRLEDAGMGVQLMLESDPAICARLAQSLDGFNRERQSIEEQTLFEAIQMVEETYSDDRRTIVLARENWHSGVIGIVASRLVERFHRPTVLIALDGESGKGSARSIAGFDLYSALCHCSQPLAGFGGHAMAAGLTVDKEKVFVFRDLFESFAATVLGPGVLMPEIRHDGEILLEDLNFSLLRELDNLHPCGAGNPQPTFVSRRCRAANMRILGDKHVKFTAEQGASNIAGIAFGMAERYEEFYGELDLMFRPMINHWRGQDTLQLQLVDFRSSAQVG